MEFSNATQESGPCSWSPDGSLLASCDGNRLLVRDTSTLMLVQIFTNFDTVSRIEWSRDSKYILCACYNVGVVQVWDVDDPDWICKIREGPAGLCHSRWSPEGRHILNTNQLNVRITVWGLTQIPAGVVASLRSPKYSDRAYDFSNDFNYLAVVERKDCKDYVQIYQCGSWVPVVRFRVETRDLADLKWAPDDRSIGVWDCNLEYVFLAYSPDGRKLGRFQAYQGALGIKTASWSPSAQFVALGSYDGQIRILNQQTWRPIRELPHTNRLSPHSCLVYRERDLTGSVQEPVTAAQGAHLVSRSCYDLVDSEGAQQRIPSLKSDPQKPNPKIGIGLMEWSADSSMLLSRADDLPNALYIWDARQLGLFAVLLQLAPIRDAKWSPRQTKLAVCTGGRTIFLWTRDGASCVQVPLEFSVDKLDWASDGRALLLRDRSSHCIAYLTAE